MPVTKERGQSIERQRGLLQTATALLFCKIQKLGRLQFENTYENQPNTE
jgi:hypothetical protein